MNHPKVVQQWHKLVETKDLDLLDKMLAEEVVFYSPVVWTPQKGKWLTTMYLGAAAHVFINDTFKYVREVIGPNDAILEFQTEIDGVVIEGVDMLHWNDEGLLTNVKVMVRPLKAIQKIHQKMGEMLENMQG
ncbi:MAG: nuclear transport factor 2 family protein [Aureispira sp.]|nr:nuclear transport factor 2 family protein [Aureispira sp.]